MMIILDNGHGHDTPGKRSPVWKDGKQLFEYEFNRDVVKRIKEKLIKENIAYHVLVPETNDISLSERVTRANKVYDDVSGKAILLSIHANAGGGTGWECFTSKGKTKSDLIAAILCEEAEKEFGKDWKMRFDNSDGDPDKEDNFTILYRTKCPAVLTENFFMDTEKDCRLIMSDDGRDRIAKFHVAAIKKYLAQ